MFEDITDDELIKLIEDPNTSDTDYSAAIDLALAKKLIKETKDGDYEILSKDSNEIINSEDFDFNSYANKMKQDATPINAEADLDNEMMLDAASKEKKGGLNPRIVGILKGRGIVQGDEDFQDEYDNFENERVKGVKNYKETGISNALQKVMDKDKISSKLKDADKERYFNYLFDKSGNLKDNRSIPEGRTMKDYLTTSRMNNVANRQKRDEYNKLIGAGLTHSEANKRIEEDWTNNPREWYDYPKKENLYKATGFSLGDHDEIIDKNVIEPIYDDAITQQEENKLENKIEQPTDTSIEIIDNSNQKDKPTTSSIELSPKIGSNFAKLVAKQGGADKARVLLNAKKEGILSDEDMKKGLDESLQEKEVKDKSSIGQTLSDTGDAMLQLSNQIGQQSKNRIR